MTFLIKLEFSAWLQVFSFLSLRSLSNNFLSPGGVAANIIDGKTIESALPLMSRNRSGVIIQEASAKADTNRKYEKLQLVTLDEVR